MERIVLRGGVTSFARSVDARKPCLIGATNVRDFFSGSGVIVAPTRKYVVIEEASGVLGIC